MHEYVCNIYICHLHYSFSITRLKSWYILMNQCPWIPEMLYRFGDMHLLFDDALGKDGKLSQNGTGENAQDIIEAFKYTFARPGNHFSHQISHDFDIIISDTNVQSIFHCD